METYLVTNSEQTKGIILKSNDAHSAIKQATDNFYSPFQRKRDLNLVQMYDKNNHMFCRCSGNKLFDYVQFHTLGGVSTSYKTTIDTEPTKEQTDFLGKPIEYIKFFQEGHRY